MDYTKHTKHILTAITVVSFTNNFNRRRAFKAAIRLDKRGGTWRVDVKFLSSEPWEAIDAGQPFTRLADAKRFANAWKRAVKEQATLTPLHIREQHRLAS